MKSNNFPNLNRIKAVLAECEVTGKELSEELEVNVNTVSNWCRNRRQPDLYTLHDIAIFLDVDISDLLTETEFG